MSYPNTVITREIHTENKYIIEEDVFGNKLDNQVGSESLAAPVDVPSILTLV